MNRLRRILLCVILALLLAVAWFIWSRPKRVDMSAYAPANTLLYMETNDPLAVVQAIVESDAWKLMDKNDGADWSGQQNRWLRRFMETTGIGPVHSVVLSRAQIAIVVTDLGTIEEGDTLTVKPEVALIIETHTSETRIRSPAEQALKKLAESTYDNPTLRRTLINGVEFVEWRSQGGSRQIVAAIVDSLLVVGNSETAVQRCLDSAARRSPSLKDDANLQRLRREFAGNRTLTFGYVPQEKSAHLLSVAVPLILGRAPGDAGFQRIVSTGAARLFGSIAWSSQPFRNGIEDRYLISLQPSFLRHLRPALSPINSSDGVPRILPEDTHSATYYRFQDPVAAWEGLRTAVSSNIDALSAVVFSSLLKSALLSYGINEPDAFLRAVNGEIVTLRLDPNGEHTLVIAGIKDRAAMRGLITRAMKFQLESKPVDHEGEELFADPQGEIGVSLRNDIVIMGTLLDVRRYAEKVNKNDATSGEQQFRRMTFFAPLSNSSPIVTYSADSDRVRNFVSVVMAAGGSPPKELANFEQRLTQLPYAATETKLVDQGFQRTTRSPLGHFSTLLPLLVRSDHRPTAPSPTSR